MKIDVTVIRGQLGLSERIIKGRGKSLNRTPNLEKNLGKMRILLRFPRPVGGFLDRERLY